MLTLSLPARIELQGSTEEAKVDSFSILKTDTPDTG